jgi:hypothetical protein
MAQRTDVFGARFGKSVEDVLSGMIVIPILRRRSLRDAPHDAARYAHSNADAHRQPLANIVRQPGEVPEAYNVRAELAQF